MLNTYFGDSENCVAVPAELIVPGVFVDGYRFPGRPPTVLVQEVLPGERWVQLTGECNGQLLDATVRNETLLDCWGAL